MSTISQLQDVYGQARSKDWRDTDQREWPASVTQMDRMTEVGENIWHDKLDFKSIT